MGSMNQCTILIRALRDFAIDLDDGFEASFMRMDDQNETTSGDRTSELTVGRDGRKVLVYARVRERAHGALGARLTQVFGLECGPWRSTLLKSPAFDRHLALASTILRRSFDWIDVDVPATWRANATRDAFLRSLSPACGPWIRRVLSSRMKDVVLLQRALAHRRRARLRSAWREWIDHFYAPDTPNGYMARRILASRKKN